MKYAFPSLVFCVSLLTALAGSQPVAAQGFAPSQTTWGLPVGGDVDGTSGHRYGFNALAGAGSYNLSDQGWSVLDLNGDGRLDLVVTSEGTGTYRDAFKTGNNYYWKVYLGTGTGAGFSTTATTWGLPVGGDVDGTSGHRYGFNALAGSGSYNLSDQGWSVLDLNNDGRLDLVVTSEGTGTYRDAFKTGNNYYWKVYLNTGAGFSTTATTWALPVGGEVDGTSGHRYGFNALAGAGSYDLSDQGWSVLDLNGDGRLDLVVNSEGTGSYRDAFSTGNNYYWKAYLGTGTGAGFSTTATTWALPVGGQVNGTSGHRYGFNALAGSGSYNLSDQGWSVLDLNNDGRLDLVVTSEGTGTYRDAFSTGNNYYWKVYLNTSTATATATPVALASAVAYPNPTRENVTLHTSAALRGAALCVRDCRGAVVLRGSITGETQALELATLPAGLYFVQVGDGKQTLKIVKE